MNVINREKKKGEEKEKEKSDSFDIAI